MATNRFFGEVARLYVRRSGCTIRLQNVTPANEPLPQDQYFHLRRDHDNYNALYSLALLASTGRHRLQIRTVNDADPAALAEIEYLVVDW